MTALPYESDITKAVAHATALGIPDYMHQELIDWVFHGRRPGAFLSAIIENDLSGAYTYADDTNQKLLYEYIFWFYNYAPAVCWGSPAALERWRTSRVREGWITTLSTKLQDR